MKNVFIVGFLFLLASCGSPDPVVLVSSNPADEAKPVSVLAQIEVNFSGALDTTSILPESIFLTPSTQEVPHPVTLTWDELTLTLLITPSRRLEYATAYNLSFPGLLDTNGAAIASTLTFSTFVNRESQITSFSAGAVTSYSQIKKTGTGNTRTTFFVLPGVDNLWFTTDDPVDRYTEEQLDSNGKLYRTVQVTTAGADGVWYNTDDVLGQYWEYTWDSEGKHITGTYYYDNPGPDGVWFTADDLMYQYIILAYNPLGQRTLGVTYTGAGPDQAWLTSDDSIFSVSKIGYNAMNRKHRIVFYSAKGADGIPGTADDGPGADNRWFTADDEIESMGLNFYDSVGNYTDNFSYRKSGFDGVLGNADDGPGPDGVWLTADDIPWVINPAVTLSGGRTGFEIYLVGPDFIPYTVDDNAWGRQEFSYDALGNQTSFLFFFPGADTLLNTADDVRVQENNYNTME